jgi:mobilization protein NikA
MPAQSEIRENSLQRLRGRVARSRSIGTKLTPDEEQQILEAAEAQGKAPSEWARDVLLRGAITTNRGEMEIHIFTELIGIQMLLMNTLEPLLRGDKMTQEQITVLFRRVQTTKAAQAQELLAKRSQNKEK